MAEGTKKAKRRAIKPATLLDYLYEYIDGDSKLVGDSTINDLVSVIERQIIAEARAARAG